MTKVYLKSDALGTVILNAFPSRPKVGINTVRMPNTNVVVGVYGGTFYSTQAQQRCSVELSAQRRYFTSLEGLVRLKALTNEQVLAHHKEVMHKVGARDLEQESWNIKRLAMNFGFVLTDEQKAAIDAKLKGDA